jgi:glyoxylase I family protein
MGPQFLDHLVFRVADLTKTERFYSIILEQEPRRAKDSIMYQVGSTRLFFTAVNQNQHAAFNKENVGLNHLAFRVGRADELQRIQKGLDKAKITHSGIKNDHYGQKDFIWLDDPDGMRVEFYCRPSP